MTPFYEPVPSGAFTAGIHAGGQASASLEILACDGSSFEGARGLYYKVEAPSLWMLLPV